MTPAHRMGNTKDASEKQLTVCLYVDFCPPGFRHMKRAVAAACFNAIRPQLLRPFRPSQADQECTIDAWRQGRLVRRVRKVPSVRMEKGRLRKVSIVNVRTPQAAA